MTYSKSARPFLERMGLVPTRQWPAATFSFDAVNVQTLPLDTPRPHADLISRGEPSPDLVRHTDPWPHGPADSE